MSAAICGAHVYSLQVLCRTDYAQNLDSTGVFASDPAMTNAAVSVTNCKHSSNVGTVMIFDF